MDFTSSVHNTVVQLTVIQNIVLHNYKTGPWPALSYATPHPLCRTSRRPPALLPLCPFGKISYMKAVNVRALSGLHISRPLKDASGPDLASQPLNFLSTFITYIAQVSHAFSTTSRRISMNLHSLVLHLCTSQDIAPQTPCATKYYSAGTSDKGDAGTWISHGGYFFGTKGIPRCLLIYWVSERAGVKC